MSQLDVKGLKGESLKSAKFPVDPRTDFRLHIALDVSRGIEQHAKADTSVEICGVLVGNWVHRRERTLCRHYQLHSLR